MSKNFSALRALRVTRLAAGLTVAIGLAFATRSEGSAPRRPDAPITRYVTSCADDGSPGTLRSQVAAANSGDTVDLATQLPMTCSTITLDFEISVFRDDLHIVGPGADHLTIDGAQHGAVFGHGGIGTLDISGLTIANGYYLGSNFAEGGCIFSNGNVSLTDSVVTHCQLGNETGINGSRGGGIFTYGDLTLVRSTLSENSIFAQNAHYSEGGGAFVSGDFKALYSTISGNTADTLGNAFGYAGGVKAIRNVDIENSTVSGNTADYYGGLCLNGGLLFPATIVDSTISSNTARMNFGGVWTNSPLTLDNSTVAFNEGRANGHGAGVFMELEPLTMHSSIIADNGGSAGIGDLDGSMTTVSGSNNLIVASPLQLPGDTVHDCPKLEPLADNGGPTRTHSLHHGSPAIDQGDSAPTLANDQRGLARKVGAHADIGAFEHQTAEPDVSIFVGGFDGLCDR